MIIVIDLDLQQAVQSFGSRQPAPAIQVKSQDTPTLSIYFAKGNVNYDLGASPGLRFGVFVAGNPNALVQYTTFSRILDAQSRVTYVGYPNFNTIQMLAAIGNAASLSAIAEIRYQTSFGTIARTLDMPVTVTRSLLSETILDTTIAAFTTPAVNANVTVRINNTGWLSTGLNLAIGAGGGAYQVVSITNATDFIAKNMGGAGNAAPATVIPSGTNVGIAATNVIQAYPDASLLELITRKGVASGYPSLDANTLIPATQIPVDTQTIAVSGGKIGSAAILATVAANFTTPATGVNVSVTLNSTTNLLVGSYVRIPIAGYYIVQSITSGTVAVLQNNGDPFNAAAGATITTGAVLLPAQAAAGGGGGTAGQNAYTLTSASFTVPSVGSTVSVAMGTTSWLGGNGYYVFISGAGYYAVNSITDGTHAVLTNTGSPSNAPPGTVVPTNAQVAASGAPGAPGASGAGLAAYDALAASFTMPLVSGNGTITIGNTAWISANQIIYIASAGYFQVASISSATQALITNLNYPGNATAGATIASGARVSPGGLQGPQGAGGPGLNAFTTLSANFTQPAVNASVTINVGTTAWIAVGQQIFIQIGGYYGVSSISDLTHAVVINLGTAGNAIPGSTVIGSGTQTVTPAGTPGTGGNAYAATSASYTQPAIGSSVTVSMGSTSWLAQNQYVFITGGGTYQVVNINDATHAVLQSVAATGTSVSGTVVPPGSVVTPAGPPGPQGATGPAGSGGGGGVDMQDPENGIEWTEHFSPPAQFPSLNGNLVLQLPWNVYGSGTIFCQGVTTTLVTSGPEFTAIDIGTNTATSIVDLTLGPSANGYNVCIPIGLGICTFKVKVAIDAIITSTDALIDSIGLFNYNVALGFYGGFFFEYNYAVSANWRCCVRTGTGTTNVTYVDSGVVVAANTWFKFKVVTNATWTSFAFYINNTLVATITTNVPTTGTDVGVAPHFLQIRTARANGRHIYPGYFYLNYPFTN